MQPFSLLGIWLPSLGAFPFVFKLLQKPMRSEMSFTSTSSMDRTELLIPAMLSEHPLMAYREMAASLKVSVPAINRRVRVLRSKGVLGRHQARISCSSSDLRLRQTGRLLSNTHAHAGNDHGYN